MNEDQRKQYLADYDKASNDYYDYMLDKQRYEQNASLYNTGIGGGGHGAQARQLVNKWRDYQPISRTNAQATATGASPAASPAASSAPSGDVGKATTTVTETPGGGTETRTTGHYMPGANNDPALQSAMDRVNAVRNAALKRRAQTQVPAE